MKSNTFFIIIGCCICLFFSNTIQAQSSNDRCLEAILIESNVACSDKYNEGTEFTGTQNNCTMDSVGSLWFKYYMAQAGKLKIKTQKNYYLDQTNFNDIVTVYKNSCSNLQEINCYNNDRFGFVGETVFTDWQNVGETLWIRISGAQDLFGKCSGKVCIEVDVVGGNEGVPPPEDNCSTAGNLSVNQPCIIGSNINATVSWTTPANNPNSDHCVWYSFIPTQSSAYSINTNADFSEVITLWTGICNSMNEIASTDLGQTLMSPALNAGQTYYVQLCGAFSSVTGNFCLEVMDSRPVTVNVSALMEGPYISSTGKMSTTLWQNNILPSTGQPYDAAPWNYNGTEGDGWTNADYPTNSVDWVLVSLRSTPQDVVDQAAGIILEDGTIQLLEPMMVSQTLPEVYVLVEHRNHLPILSPTKVQIINNVLSYDFKQSNSYLGGASGQKPIDGFWMMFAGNVDQSNPSGYEITGSDRILWDGENGLFDIYTGTDFNLDRDVTGADRILWQDNNGTFSNIPK